MMDEMELKIKVDKEVGKKLTEVARERGYTPEELAQEIVESYLFGRFYLCTLRMVKI